MIEDMDRILREGEGQHTDFKESMDKDFATEVVAFANAQGGRIFIGINDKNKIVGTDTSNKVRSQIQDQIRNIDPHPDAVIEVHDNVIVVTIPEGDNKPYLCSKGCYLRIGANSQKLERDEIVEFIRSEELFEYDSKVRNGLLLKDRFNMDAYKTFIRKAGISDQLPCEHVLTNLKCAAKNEKGESVYTNAGALFFRDNTGDVSFDYAGVACVIFKGFDKAGKIIEVKRFYGTIPENIEDTIKFLWKNLRVRYEFNGSARRRELLEIPVDALRESVVNAVCHRDYLQEGSNIMVEIYDDRVEITNPGGLPKGMTMDELGTKSVVRNKIIADMLMRTDYVEKIGTGIKRIRELMEDEGLEPPVFTSTRFFTATFKRPPMHIPSVGKQAGGTVPKLPTDLTENEIKMCELISRNEKVTRNEIVEQTGISESTVKRTLNSLVEKGVVKRFGSDRTGYWKIL